jgi:hypothetical protein
MRINLLWQAAVAAALNLIFVSALIAASPQRLRADVSPRCALEIDLRTDARAACWRLKCSAKPARTLGCDLSAMHQIDTVSISPNRKYIAVLSVGEGHPILEIAALAPLLKNGKFASLCEVNPYPGTIRIGNWSGGKLLIQTDVDLQLEDTAARASSIGESMRETLIDPQHCLARADFKNQTTKSSIKAPLRQSAFTTKRPANPNSKPIIFRPRQHPKYARAPRASFVHR